jgi:hypothetical protein
MINKTKKRTRKKKLDRVENRRKLFFCIVNKREETKNKKENKIEKKKKNKMRQKTEIQRTKMMDKDNKSKEKKRDKTKRYEIDMLQYAKKMIG